jgi:5'-nucleotidase
MEKSRRQFTPRHKVVIWREHFVEHVPASALCGPPAADTRHSLTSGRKTFLRTEPQPGATPIYQVILIRAMMRGVPAAFHDGVYCVRLAQNAVHAAMAKRTGRAITSWHLLCVHVSLSFAIATRKRVDPKGDLRHSVIEPTGHHQSFARLAIPPLSFISHTADDSIHPGDMSPPDILIHTRMKAIAVDMDGVIANVFEQYLALDEKHTGRRKSAEELKGIPEMEAFERAREYILTRGFFRNAPVIQDSQGVLYRLNQVYDVYIVSSATEYPNSLAEKYEWLQEHFPFISWQKMVFCGSKNIIRADIMIDDHVKNLDSFIGVTYLFSAPHNHLVSSDKHLRVHSWREVAEVLL